jgi:MFS family permease
VNRHTKTGIFYGWTIVLVSFVTLTLVMGSRFTFSAGLGLIALPCLISVHTAPDAWRVVLFVPLIGLGYGGTSVLYGTVAADRFQGPHLGKILGILDMGFGLGAAFGSYLTGVLFDRYQTYQPSFTWLLA